MVDASEGICKLFINNVLEDDKHILTSVIDFVPKENYKAQKRNARLFNFSKSMLLLLDDKEVNENWIHWSQSEKSAYFLEKARLVRENNS